MDIEKLNNPNIEAERQAKRLEAARAAVEQAQWEIDHAQTDKDIKIWENRKEQREKDLKRIEEEQIADIAA